MGFPSELETDHVEMARLLSDFTRAQGSNDAEGAFRQLDLFWARLAMHIRAEHLHLFPAVLKISEKEKLPDISATIVRLRSDHDFFMHELAKAVKRLRLIDDENRDGVMAETAKLLAPIASRLDEHNRIEEQSIYPLASRYLTADELDRLSDSVRRELENFPPRFRVAG